MKFRTIWHKQSPIWRNLNLLSGGEPFIMQSWAASGIQTLGDVSGQHSIRDFPDLLSQFNIPRNSLFFYFRLRSALNSLGVPWGSDLPIHPIISLIKNAPRRGAVSYIYDRLIAQSSVTPLGLRLWERDLPQGQEAIDWKAVWNNVFGSSKNPNHQLIHYKICHRTYLTPHKRHLMGLAPHPYCTFCAHGVLGTFMHVLWECPEVQRFWTNAMKELSGLIGKQIPLDPVLLLLNDDSKFELVERQRKLWLAGLTATKRMIVLRWLPPHHLSMTHWLRTFLEVIHMEWSSARVNGAKAQTLLMWNNAADRLKNMLS